MQGPETNNGDWKTGKSGRPALRSGREIEEKEKRKKEEKAQKRNGFKAETQGEAADHQEIETASEPTENATMTLVHGDGKGGVPRDPPEPDPFCR